jgi:DNA gyrase subunit A
LIDEDDGAEEFTEESFIVEEDTYTLITRDGWIKRQRTLNLETTRMREGDEVLGLVGGSTRETIVFFTNMGSAYVTRIHDIPPSTGHGTPVQKLFKFKDGERLVGTIGCDPRVMPEFAFDKPTLGEEYEEPYPHLLAVTKQGMSLRFTLWPHREPSTTRGRLYARLKEGDEVVSVFKVYAEDEVCAVSRSGRMLCCVAQEVNLLGGAGRGVTFIKLDREDEVVAAFPAKTPVVVTKSSGGEQKITAGDRETTSRGGKGRPLFKRGTVQKLQFPAPAAPELTPPPGK